MAERATKQKLAIERALDEAEHPSSIEEIFERASDHVAGLGIATVYRRVNALLAEGRLEAVEVAGEPPRYERAGKQHHHHFRCERCAQMFDLEGCTLDVSGFIPPGFELHAHSLDLYGLCANCAPAPSPPRSPR